MLPSTTLPGPALPAVDRVVAGLMDLILGELTPGAQLPSEAELATTYEVSRLTVREAVKVLSGRGLLDLSRGRRAIVREPDGSAFGDFLAASMRHDAKGLLDLIEVRQALEIQSATLCAASVFTSSRCSGVRSETTSCARISLTLLLVRLISATIAVNDAESRSADNASLRTFCSRSRMRSAPGSSWNTRYCPSSAMSALTR